MSMSAKKPALVTLVVAFALSNLAAEEISKPDTPVIELLQHIDESPSPTISEPPLVVAPSNVCRTDRINSLLNSPDRIGYGAQTTGGAAADAITWVTNLNDSGPGSLRTALESASPKWIAFDEKLKGGTIYVESQLPSSGDFTIDGRGNSGPLDITLAATDSTLRHMLVLWNGNVIIHGITLDGNNTNGTALLPRTGSNFWIDHVTIKNWITDDAIGIGKLSESNTADNITISNYHAFDTSKAILFGGEDEDTRPKTGKLTLFSSILAAKDRNPRVSRYQHAHILHIPAEVEH